MTLNELLFAAYGWADANGLLLLAASVLLPFVGTVLAWIGKAGKTDADGRFVASTLMGVALFAVSLELVVLFLAQALHDRSPLDANAALIAAPVVCLVASVVGVRMVFPLSELGSVRTAVDLGAFLLCCAALVWFMSKFRGWSLMFFGSFTQLLVALALAAFFLRRMYRRAFGVDRAPPSTALR